MKLSELVAHKNLLDTLSAGKLADHAAHGLGSMIEIIKRDQLPIPEQLEDLDTYAFVMANAMTGIDQTLHDIRSIAQQEIEKNEDVYFENSNQLYLDMQHEEVDYILNRTKIMRDSTRDLVDSRMKLYTDWRFPGMIIRPAAELHVENLVALDPLYLVDTKKELLEPAVKRFTLEYQARLRCYAIQEYTGEPIFNKLPEQQFGFVFSHNYFQYKPIDIIKQYLDEIFNLLRPSGVVGFTYNDCDFAHSVRLTEKPFHCYTPGRLIKQHAISTGFEVLFEYHGDENIHWIELGKPGEKQSIRGGQSMAAIVSKNNLLTQKKSKYLSSKLPNDIDIDLDITYTNDDVLKLQISAVLLGIDTEERIFGLYTTEKLHRLVDLRMNQGGIDIKKFNEKLEIKFNKRKKS